MLLILQRYVEKSAGACKWDEVLSTPGPYGYYTEDVASFSWFIDTTARVLQVEADELLAGLGELLVMSATALVRQPSYTYQSCLLS
jgi:hypothetical protein